MGFFTRLRVPRSVRHAVHPRRAVKRAVTPKVLRKARRATHLVDNAMSSRQAARVVRMIARLAAVAATALVMGLAGFTSATASPTRSPDVSVHHGAAATAAPAKLRCSPRAGRKLVWHGGPIQNTAYVVIIFWGSWWRTHGAAVKSELHKLYGGLGTSAWAATLTQYCDQFGPPAWPSNLLAGSPIIDRKNPPRAPTDRQFGAEVTRWAQTITESVGIDVVVTPPGTAPAYDGRAGACGHHSWTAVRKSGGNPFDQPWIDIPYGIILKSHGCGWKLKQGVPGALSVVAGHEWAEAVTDPFVNSTKKSGLGTGWATTGLKPNNEAADLCEPGFRFHFFHKNSFMLKLKTGSFVMQKLWSNAARKCVKVS